LYSKTSDLCSWSRWIQRTTFLDLVTWNYLNVLCLGFQRNKFLSLESCLQAGHNCPFTLWFRGVPEAVFLVVKWNMKLTTHLHVHSSLCA
jgi:hypothetical protein